MYLDDWLLRNPFGKGEKIIELDAAWFGANKLAAGGNKQA